MAGIGVKLNKIFNKNTITTDLYGVGYSVVMTVAPMFLVIGSILIMQLVLGFSTVGYAARELFACTVLYIFIFSLLTASPFNAVLSRYLSDVIFNETYDDVMPCFNLGLLMNLVVSSAVGIPFCVHEYFVGHVDLFFVLAGYFGFILLAIIFYSMLYLSICKDYRKISLFFLLGAILTVLSSLIFVYLFHWEITFSMLVALDLGFLLIASLEIGLIRAYFKGNSGKYGEVIKYFQKYWQLVLTNFLYTLGLYIHNFVFWTTNLRMEVVNSFVCVTTYDMATCLAMFTNISASVIFISRVEMHFHSRYKAYSEAVIGGRGMDIENAKKRMFRQLGDELVNLVRIQFIVTVVIYLLCVVLLPQLGYGGSTMRIYPCLAAGYFVLFIMYSCIIFLYYFNDLKGALFTAIAFCTVTALATIPATHLSEIWYGIGLVIGALAGWTIAYFRLRYLERNLDVHVYCKGSLQEIRLEAKPSGKVYDRRYSSNDPSKKEKSVTKEKNAAE